MNKTQEEFYKLAGERIMKLRLTNNLSREALAELAGISSKFLYEIETGKKGFSACTLERISQALAIRSDYIITGNQRAKSCEDIYTTIELFDESKLKMINDLLEMVYKMGSNL